MKMPRNYFRSITFDELHLIVFIVAPLLGLVKEGLMFAIGAGSVSFLVCLVYFGYELK